MNAKPRILIVEDSLIVAVHLQSTLESEGYDVVGKCVSAEEALQFLNREKTVLVLMDIMLSGKMNGVDAAHLIKLKYDTPVIFITALTDKETIQRAKLAEPYGYLMKPFEDHEIFTVIEMAWYKHSIRQKLKESEEKYFSTVKSISDAVIVIDKDFRINYINPSASALLRYAMAEVYEKPLEQVVRLTSDGVEYNMPVNPLQSPIGKLNSGDALNNLILFTKDNRQVPISSSVSVLIDSQDELKGLILIFRDLTEKREREKLIRDIEKQRIAALIEGQEKERSRIAKDLHDGLGQILNVVKMNVNSAVDDKQKAAELDKLLDEAIQESIRISENLLPSKLRDFDLSTCLRSLCKNMNEKGHVPITFKHSGSPAVLEQSKKVNLYRIAQEAITNAIKHANATEISVRLEEREKLISLRIEDNGNGILPVKDDHVHNGLINIRERTEVLEGKLSITSHPERGTLIIIDTPILIPQV
ncbi:hypothetical protein WSM22_41970 [Cytophagales bacterium WSM2-2]|nr:hypothetical protein WSM22_41970 [Cytophagales bacterium WSM2-2]